MIFHIKILVCPKDNRTFSNNQAYSIHLKHNHSEIFPDFSYECSVCSKAFKTLSEKLAHMKLCDKKTFSCDHCERKFALKCLLKSHLERVSGQSEVVCDLCEKRCSDKANYEIHRRSHFDEKLFKCTLCDKAYKTSSARAAHLETHGENLKCDYCRVLFNSRRTLRRHVKQKHSEFLETSVWIGN